MLEENKRLLKDALKLLRIHDVSESNLEKFLEKKGYEKTEIRETIKYLKEKNLVDDAKVASLLVEKSIRQKRGINYARSILASKGIPESVISITLARMYPEILEYKIAKELLFSSKKNVRKAIYWLASRGFSDETIEKLREENQL
ncbi:MAG: RecX family transcriptional regulator [Candidatus Omnitrophica bacterium]|nr:RecX family transcriptional regulator [Candidatus Omnitrophota bacterium]